MKGPHYLKLVWSSGSPQTGSVRSTFDGLYAALAGLWQRDPSEARATMLRILREHRIARRGRKVRRRRGPQQLDLFSDTPNENTTEAPLEEKVIHWPSPFLVEQH